MHFPPEVYRRALEDWAWVGADTLTPLATSRFGDVFLAGPGGILMLDTLEGSLVPAFAGTDEMRDVLATEAGQDRYLMAGLALAAERHGLVPAAGQVYAYTVPPILGGRFAVDNLTVLDFEVWLTITGQLHEQVRAMPPGSRITKFTVGYERPAGGSERADRA